MIKFNVTSKYMPSYATEKSHGLDIHAINNVAIMPSQTKLYQPLRRIREHWQMTITGHEIEFHLDTKHMLSFLNTKYSLYSLANKLGVSKSVLYYYKDGTRQCKNRSIYDAILTTYYKERSKEYTKRLFKEVKGGAVRKRNDN